MDWGVILNGIKKLYESNMDFKRYVDRYCRTYRLTVEVALEHKLVQEVGKHYIESAATETMQIWI